MPVEFLTRDQRRSYGRYAGSLSAEQLARYFHLSEEDRSIVRGRRGARARLGFALQLGTVRFLGTFLADPSDIPFGVIEYTARQLGIPNPTACLTGYRESQGHWNHVREIRRRYGYREFNDQPEHFRFVRWLFTMAWASPQRPSVLFDLATSRLVHRKILLPGVTTLTRLVARVRDRADARLWRKLSSAPSPAQLEALEKLPIVPEGKRQSELHRLRRAPTGVNAVKKKL